jgi:hypothetical protein
MAGELVYSEQVTALITPAARVRLDALAAGRRQSGAQWPDYSLGAVIRDVIDAGLGEIDQED